MIAGIGTDLVSILRISKLLQRYGNAFAKRILHDNEWEQWQQSGENNAQNLTRAIENHKPALKIAKYWAVKEAVAKSIGTGFSQSVSWRDIELHHDKLGKPHISVHRKTAEIAKQKLIKVFHLSLSDEKDYVQTFVVAEQGSQP